MIKTIPLEKLVASPRNVRRVVDEQADLQLKTDIEARGLLQNLVVTPLGRSRGRFAVEAGGRRLRALQSLAADGKVASTLEIPCFVLSDPNTAQEASLAENFQRLSMNPADECLAFRRMIENGADLEAVARRFGLTVRFVDSPGNYSEKTADTRRSSERHCSRLRPWRISSAWRTMTISSS